MKVKIKKRIRATIQPLNLLTNLHEPADLLGMYIDLRMMFRDIILLLMYYINSN